MPPKREGSFEHASLMERSVAADCATEAHVNSVMPMIANRSESVPIAEPSETGIESNSNGASWGVAKRCGFKVFSCYGLANGLSRQARNRSMRRRLALARGVRSSPRARIGSWRLHRAVGCTGYNMRADA